MRPSFINAVTLFCCAVAGLLNASLCQADVVEYTLDSERSVLTLSGTMITDVFGTLYSDNIEGQISADSLVTTYSGTIRASRTGNVLSFDAASSIVADENVDAPFEPATLGVVENYGFAVFYSNFPLTGTADIKAAVRNMTLDFGGLLEIDSAPSLMTINLPTIEIDDNDFVTAYSDLGQNAVANESANLVTLEIVDNKEWLTIPIVREAVAVGMVGTAYSVQLNYTLTGELRAYRAVPEPGTWVLLSLGLLGLMVARRRFGASSN